MIPAHYASYFAAPETQDSVLAMPHGQQKLRAITREAVSLAFRQALSNSLEEALHAKALHPKPFFGAVSTKAPPSVTCAATPNLPRE